MHDLPNDATCPGDDSPTNAKGDVDPNSVTGPEEGPTTCLAAGDETPARERQSQLDQAEVTTEETVTIVLVDTDQTGAVSFTVRREADGAQDTGPTPSPTSSANATVELLSEPTDRHTNITYLLPTMACQDAPTDGDPAGVLPEDILGPTPQPRPLSEAVGNPENDVNNMSTTREPLDLLDRVLVRMFNEEDLVRAETSRHLDEAELHYQLEERKAELALGCDTTLDLQNAPDVTSTPRAERFAEDNPGSPSPELLRVNGRNHSELRETAPSSNSAL